MSFTHLKTTHSYHLVDPSPWPIVAAFGAFMLTSVGVLYMHRYIGGWSLFIVLEVIFLLLILIILILKFTQDTPNFGNVK